MYWKNVLEALTRSEGIPESEIDWDEVEWFERTHGEHFQTRLNVYRADGKVESVDFECEGLISEKYCPGWIDENRFSIVYQPENEQSREDSEIQRRRREG